MEPIIQLDHVNFRYDPGQPNEFRALTDISITVNKGEYAAFFGPSGSGKTTLLYLISGIEQGQDGKILISGRDISTFTKQELAVYRQVGVGMIFQQFNLIPSLTVAQNVALPMSFLGVSQDRGRKEAVALLARVGLEKLADRYPSELSGGQQQRVAIVRALANNPPVIVADEPLGNLDSANAQTVLEFLKELNEKDGRTIVMVTHEAWSLRDARKIFYLKDGVVTKEEIASPKTLSRSITEHLHNQLAPSLSKEQMTAQALSNLLLRGYSDQEIKRFEFFLNQRFADKIDAEVFRMVLDRSFKEGGLGLWRQKAEKVARWVEEVIEEERNVEDIYRELEAHPESPLKDNIEKLKAWLLEDYHGKVTEAQGLQLSEVIAERLRGVVPPDQFAAVLTLPRSKLGLGFAMHTAERMKQKLELVLEQGHPKIEGFSHS